jgi:hypothetical protein
MDKSAEQRDVNTKLTECGHIIKVESKCSPSVHRGGLSEGRPGFIAGIN